MLFADIKSSMELVADRDPEDARALLDPVLELMLEAVHAYEGIVNQVMGDGIMALFGAPLALEDHALRAGYAALRMLAGVASRSGDVERVSGVPLQVRIGINSGEVIVRSIGSDLDMDYTAVGQTTHLAARLEQMAQPGTVLCSSSTLALAGGRFQTRPLGAVTVRGLHEPVEVAELVDVVFSRLRFHTSAARGLTPFVGRRQERAAVAEVLARTEQGGGQLIALVGEPGVGKSRLAWEMTRSPQASQWLVLEAGAVSYDVGTPYLPLRTLLARYFEIDDRDDVARARERVVDRLRALGSGLADVAAPMLSLLELPIEDAGWIALDPSLRRQQTGEAFRRVLLREAEDRPVLLVVEDLHWIDRETETLLAGFVERLGGARLALLLTSRPEHSAFWGSKVSATQIRIEPFARADAEEMLGVLIGGDPSVAPLVAALIERTGGNPFYLEESVRTLVERGTLSGEPGHYRLTGAVEDIHVPPSVHAVIAARIDRLRDDEKRLLQSAAAIGPIVAVDVLRAVADTDTEVTQAAVMRLREAGFLFERRLYPEVEYAFSHSLVADVAYGGMLHERRRALHARIVEVLETMSGGRSTEQVERLAHHALRGELWEKAVGYTRQSATKAAARSAYREAVGHLEQALTALSHLPRTPQAVADAVDVRLELRSALFPLREIARDLESLQVAKALAEEIDDRRRLAWVLTYMTRDLSILGQPERAIESGQRALELAPATGDVELEVLANGYLGSVCFARGEYARAVGILEGGVSLLAGDRALQRFGLPGPAAVFFRVWLVSSLTRLGEYERAAQHVRESLEVAQRADQPLARLVARYTEGFLHAHRPDLPRAIQALETSLDLCRTWKLPAWFSNVASVLGWAYAKSERMDEGVALMQQAIDESAAGGGMVNHSSEVARLAEARLLARDHDEARRLAERALALAHTHQERGNEAFALYLLGEIASRSDTSDLEPAKHHLLAAVALASELGMRPLLAAAHGALARVYREMGLLDAARAAEATAEAMTQTPASP